MVTGGQWQSERRWELAGNLKPGVSTQLMWQGLLYTVFPEVPAVVALVTMFSSPVITGNRRGLSKLGADSERGSKLEKWRGGA